MASSSGGGNSRSSMATVNAAATAINSGDHPRFPAREERRRWRGCFGGFSCFGSQKRGKRIVPASRMPEGNSSGNRPNGAQVVGVSNQATSLTPSLLAPPSSPASFTNSGLPSTVQSPTNFLSLSANVCSPGGPSSTMYATGPYAHETQLVSPPVFSTFTTEPSTAPFTPPPELAHLTTPSSPDVPFARLLSSSIDVKNPNKENGVPSPFMSPGYEPTGDLQATYQLYPGSPASHLVSPKSGVSGDGLLSPSLPDSEFPMQWGTSIPKNEHSKLFGLDIPTSRSFILSQEDGFLYPATSPQFYLDQAQQPGAPHSHCAGRLSLSRETDAYSNGGNVHQNRHNVEEIEAYRASFGFSADEIISTPHYVELSDVLEDSFTMCPFPTHNTCSGECSDFDVKNEGEDMAVKHTNFLDFKYLNSSLSKIDEGLDGRNQKEANKEVADVALCEPCSPNDYHDICAKVGQTQCSPRARGNFELENGERNTSPSSHSDGEAIKT
ncbi:uncharacterized protein At1g76660 isoform X1 [Amborella trichopoda]|uniref:uncharacterized protein At1g76660 isoform X1 n=1 Tax=Amborella trichopoda TaxID=13333 RepID=UPI0005D377E8|nr:uncharacterized protein At1g76660 isoform X1 [Amborella trichopoda]|eukprot:XP_011625403.1 uncharacterized protein At1g76660 isoform X1 [Amborella trichopoda]